MKDSTQRGGGLPLTCLKLTLTSILLSGAVLCSPLGQQLRTSVKDNGGWQQLAGELVTQVGLKSGLRTRLDPYQPPAPAPGAAEQPLGDYRLNPARRNAFRAHYGPTPDTVLDIYPDDVLVRDDLSQSMLDGAFQILMRDLTGASRRLREEKRYAFLQLAQTGQVQPYDPDEDELPQSSAERLVLQGTLQGEPHWASLEVKRDTSLGKAWRDLREARQNLWDYVEGLKLPK